MFYYIPLPPYKERYTEYLSVEDGIFERQLKKYAIAFKSIRPRGYSSRSLYTINTGQVVDLMVMTDWAFYQIRTLCGMISIGEIKEGDIIYFDDFWTPGMEMVPYALSLKGLFGKVKLGAFCHAQSVDPNDFTAQLMSSWIRGFEDAWEGCLDIVTVAAQDMIDKWKKAWNWFPNDSALNFRIIGLPSFDSEYLIKEIGCHSLVGPRTRNVIYSSRLDREKRPELFLRVAEAVMFKRSDITFTICTGADGLRSNEPNILTRINKLKNEYPKQFYILTGLTKKQYYTWLAYSAVQMNTSLQDLVSWTLLEAATFGCVPFYPISNPTFDEAIGISPYLRYNDQGSILSIAEQLIELVEYSTQREVSSIKLGMDKEFEWIYKKYELATARILAAFNLIPAVAALPTIENCKDWDYRYMRWLKTRDFVKSYTV